MAVSFRSLYCLLRSICRSLTAYATSEFAAAVTAALDVNDVFEGKEVVEKIKVEIEEIRKGFSTCNQRLRTTNRLVIGQNTSFVQ